MIAPVQTRLQNILLADDGSEHSNTAVQLIAALPHPPDCVVTAMRVFTPTQASDQARIEEHLLATRDLLTGQGLNVRTEFVLGYPAEKLLEYADEHHPDLIVMGAKGIRNALGIPLGGVAMHLVEDGRFPVLVVRSPFTGLKKVLLVSDGSPCSELACDYLGAFPLPKDTQVTVMHVLPPILSPIIMEPGMGAVSSHTIFTSEDIMYEREQTEKEGQAVLDQAVRRMQMHGLEVDGHITRGDAAEEIINFARENGFNLIVAGSRGMGTVRGWLMGSVSRKLVHYSDCSVLIARCANKKE